MEDDFVLLCVILLVSTLIGLVSYFFSESLAPDYECPNCYEHIKLDSCDYNFCPSCGWRVYDPGLKE